MADYVPINIYGDESCQNAHRYMVIGCVAVIASQRARIIADFDKIKLEHNNRGYVKWTRVKAKNLNQCKRLVSKFFELNRSNDIVFHCIVIDCHRLDHHKWNAGSRELGFSKFVYQILLKFLRLYAGDFYVVLDRRTTQHSPEELRTVLNNGAATKLKKNPARRPYKSVIFREMEDETLLQIADILTGAVAFCANDRKNDPVVGPAKKELAAHIEVEARLRSLALQTPFAHRHFSIWHLRLR